MSKMILITIASCLTACGGVLGQSAKNDNSGSAQNFSAGNGGKYEGVGALSVPTAEAVVARIQNGLENNVSSLAGNFNKSLKLVKTNLPKVSDPTQATGFDQVQLLVYAACTDLTANKMQSVYNVDPNASIGQNQQNLINAGVRMLDRYVAGLASQSTAASDVNKTLTQLILALANDTTNTSKMAFVSVCVAANTAGSTLMGF